MITPSGFSGPSHNHDLEAIVFHKTMKKPAFYPVGASVEVSYGSDDINIFYFPTTEEIDANWLKAHFPANGDELFELLGKGFSQYCGDNWCGMDMRDLVLAALGDYSDEPASLQFKKEGYPPFFEIQDIFLYPSNNAIVVSGRVDIDSNLEEHGVDIKICDSGVEFGYGADFMDLKDLPNTR